MSKATSLLRQIERRIANRRRPGAVMVMYWGDEEVTDDDGRRMSLEEWERLHPEAAVIQLRWGDEGGDVALSHAIPADVWNNL